MVLRDQNCKMHCVIQKLKEGKSALSEAEELVLAELDDKLMDHGKTDQFYCSQTGSTCNRAREDRKGNKALQHK